MSIPWITLITAMRVVVARMMPNNVKKLRNLLDWSDCAATRTASQNEAFAFILDRDGRFIAFVP
jgi:hypothetical protein